MESEESVHPLRLSKNGSGSSPTKMASSIPRALTEISPTEKRRNSPSWKQSPKKMAPTTDSSPFQSSPLEGATSPRLFWQNRSIHTENKTFGSGRSGSPSPTRRPSVERLQKASRVKNSNILALEHKQEYDPTRVPHIERPLAKVQGNAYSGNSSSGLPSPSPRGLGHHRNQSSTSIPIYSPTKPILPPPSSISQPSSPTKEHGSPIKSSLSTSRFKSSFDPETGAWSADTSCDERELPDGKALHRHAKSVTFDAAPPQVNEYEMATPDISSIESHSREGSYESDEDDEDDDLDDEDDDDEHYMMHDGHGHHGQDDSFDASLEDTDKTPVVGPDDDWRRETLDDFEHSPMPEDAHPGPLNGGRQMPQQHKRTDSSNSNSGDHRPLPPLPGAPAAAPQLARSHSTSSNGLSATAERMLGSHRSLPSPPPASATKSEIHSIGNTKMTLEERLKLMMLSDDGKSAAELQRERRMRRAGPSGGLRDRHESQTPEREMRSSPSVQSPPSASAAASHGNHNHRDEIEADEEDDTIGELSGLEEYHLPPRISRESILRRVNGNKAFERESDYHFSSPPPASSPERRLPFDPDVPLPSTEDSILEGEHEDDDETDAGSVIVKRESEEKEVDVYSIPEMHHGSDLDSQYGDIEEVQKPRGHGLDDDTESQYSDEKAQDSQEDQVLTPRAATPVGEPPLNGKSLELATGSKDIDFSKDFESYMLSEKSMVPEPEKMQRPRTPEQKLTRSLSKPEYDGSGWGGEEEYDEEEEDSQDEPSTPDSVIHHPQAADDYDDELARASPIIPEQMATIKSASGSKLKTRPSATPSDIMAMREARRQVSREMPTPSVPPIPERHRNHRISRDLDDLNVDLGESTQTLTGDDFLERHPSFKNRSLTLDLDLGLSLDKDFERVIEAQKRGYLMRQNTKLVAASDKESDDFRACRSAGNSPVKQSHGAGARPQSWTVEPWNGQTRKRSVRKRTAGLPPASGPVPPLPGQESNAVVPTSGLSALPEDDMSAEMATEESGERGRLFVKVMGVKDLDLPLPKNERTWFSLTLDNGVHCVTTAWLELARNAPIGQEFELVVPNDLEFQLTLNVKLEKPAPRLPPSTSSKTPSSPTKISRPKTSTFSRVFASPKKRKEMEARARAAEEEERLALQQQQQMMMMMQQRGAAAAASAAGGPTAWDLLSPLAAEDGSFARAYVCLKEHESRCFGRPYVVDVAAFNEWASEEAAFASSVKSKRLHNTSTSNTGLASGAAVRRAPYKIGKLELQLLFVPRPKGVTDDDMPKSMNSCIREMKAAEERLSRNWEGHLSQQGGDCPYWRRRYFKLVGTKLTAYHEATRQPRATINLANAKRLIDDRQTLTEKETTGKGGRRRRSAFAEEEEGYMFVEEGFRIRFNNGEVIDFYADSTRDKDGWMAVLGEVIGRDSIGSAGGNDDDSIGGGSSRAKGKWCELVLKREEALRKRAEGRRVHSRTKSLYM